MARPRSRARPPLAAGPRRPARWLSRPVRLLLAAAAILLILAFPLAVLAQGETIGGTLAYRAGDERTPVEGVSITVSQDGNEIGTAVSDAEGVWDVALPGTGTYQVILDVSTLPEGVGLTDPSRAELPNVNVLGGQRKVVLFPLRRARVEPAATELEAAAAIPVAELPSMRASAGCSWLVSNWGRPSRSPR